MVRLLSLLILLLLPNPFATPDPVGAGADIPATMTAPRPPRPAIVEATHPPARVESRALPAEARLGEPVPAAADSMPVVADPAEPPIL